LSLGGKKRRKEGGRERTPDLLKRGMPSQGARTSSRVQNRGGKKKLKQTKGPKSMGGEEEKEKFVRPGLGGVDEEKHAKGKDDGNEVKDRRQR